MTVIPGSWAGMIPFFSTSPCGCWIYDLPLLTNQSTSFETWIKTVTPGADFNQTSFPWVRDDYLVIGDRSVPPVEVQLQQPGCSGYTATIEIFDIPPSVPAAMLAYLNSYVTTTSPGPYNAHAFWTLNWAGFVLSIETTCFYYWPLSIVAPDISFSTSWSLNYVGSGTPDFAYPVSGSSSNNSHPLAGLYTITNAPATIGSARFEHSTGVGAIEDVIGTLTLLRTDCPPFDGCASWIYQWPSLTNRGNVPDYPLTETVYETTGPGTPLHLVPYTQRVYSTLDTGIFYSAAHPMSCAYQTTTLTIAQIPASLVATIAAQAHAEGTALGSAYGYVLGATWQLHWNDIDVLIDLVITSNFTGSVFDPGPRTLTYQMAWDFTVHGTTIATTSGTLIETTTHPFAGSYNYSDVIIGAAEIGYSYVISSSDVARMGDVFSYASIVTHDTP